MGSMIDDMCPYGAVVARLLRKMESDGADLISSGSQFDDKGPATAEAPLANFVRYMDESQLPT